MKSQMVDDSGSRAGDALTDEGFWDDQWWAREKASPVARFLRAKDHGPDGRFIRLFKAVLGRDIVGKRVVELGGACSRSLVDLANEGALVTAVDYSPVGVQQTREMFDRCQVAGRVIQADMFEVAEDLGVYDIVTHWGLLEHFEDPLPVMKVSANLVDRDGLLVFTMPNMGAVGAGLWRFSAPKNYAAHIFHSDEAIVKAVTTAGLILVRSFHAGLPLLRMSPGERFLPLSLVIDACHAGFLLLARLLPGLFLAGNRYISDTRGFVFRRA